MKIVAISDTHNHTVDLPEADLLVVAGDLTSVGRPGELRRFNEYLEQQSSKFKHKPLVIAGNHDLVFQDNPGLAMEALGAASYLEDELIEIEGIKIYGSPWTPTFYTWAFMKDRGQEIRAVWDMIPEGLDLLITHGPPHGILDFCGSHAGCEELLDVVGNALKSPPRYHVFGHIHESYGKHQSEKTTFLNVAVCNHAYSPVNKPTVFEI